MKKMLFFMGIVLVGVILASGCLEKGTKGEQSKYDSDKIMSSTETLDNYFAEVEDALANPDKKHTLPEDEWFGIPGGWRTLQHIAFARGYLPPKLREELIALYNRFTRPDVKIDFLRYFMSDYLTDDEKDFLMNQFNKETDTTVKYYILTTLGKSPDDDTAQFALKLLKENPQDIKRYYDPLFNLLAYTYNEKYIPFIEQAYKEGKDPEYRGAALNALVELKGNAMQDELLRLLNESKGIDNASMIPLYRIVDLLGKCGDEKAIDPLIEAGELMSDEDMKEVVNLTLDYIAIKYFNLDVDRTNAQYDFGVWRSWRKENPDFNARKAQITYLKEYVENGKPPSDYGYFNYFRIYYLHNEEAIPYMNKLLNVKMGVDEMWPSQFDIAACLMRIGYAEGYLFLVGRCISDEDLKKIPEMNDEFMRAFKFSARRNLMFYTGTNFETKEEWVKWLNENKDKFKTISAGNQ